MHQQVWSVMLFVTPPTIRGVFLEAGLKSIFRWDIRVLVSLKKRFYPNLSLKLWHFVKIWPLALCLHVNHTSRSSKYTESVHCFYIQNSFIQWIMGALAIGKICQYTEKRSMYYLFSNKVVCNFVFGIWSDSIYVCMYVCICMYVCVCVCLCVFVCVCMCVYV